MKRQIGSMLAIAGALAVVAPAQPPYRGDKQGAWAGSGPGYYEDGSRDGRYGRDHLIRRTMEDLHRATHHARLHSRDYSLVRQLRADLDRLDCSFRDRRPDPYLMHRVVDGLHLVAHRMPVHPRDREMLLSDARWLEDLRYATFGRSYPDYARRR